MKIVMVGPFGLRPHGTMSRRALPLAKALVARGHDVEIVLPPWSCPEDSGQVWEDQGALITNVTLPPSVPACGDALIVGRLLRRALAGRPRVVHFFKPKGYAGLSAFLTWHLQTLRLARTRVVLDSDDWEGHGGWNEVGDYSWLEKRFFAWQERWGIKHCHALTVASRTLEDLALEMDVAADNVFYLPNGTSGPDELPDQQAGTKVRAEWALGSDPVVLLFTRFFEFDHAAVIGAFGKVVAEVPSTRFLVVGSGLSGREQKSLLELAQRAGLYSHIAHAGWRERGELAGYFAASDLALVPLEDTLLNRARCPAKLVDLMAAGLPVVANQVGQVSEYIEHMSSGYLVPPGDIDALTAGILRLLSDPQLRSRLGEQARRRVMEEFGWPELAAIAERAYAA